MWELKIAIDEEHLASLPRDLPLTTTPKYKSVELVGSKV
jgi:hypothetical protein